MSDSFNPHDILARLRTKPSNIVNSNISSNASATSMNSNNGTSTTNNNNMNASNNNKLANSKLSQGYKVAIQVRMKRMYCVVGIFIDYFIFLFVYFFNYFLACS
jgi:hypothetical protein